MLMDSLGNSLKITLSYHKIEERKLWTRPNNSANDFDISRWYISRLYKQMILVDAEIVYDSANDFPCVMPAEYTD